ncbi:hypothetical protein LSUE1_G008830 [Lachnellula suecica]|uniref:Uncharacterized protein n=1 Tax=Lachnellula suecica TaxID=602035 RepID=A0A8T9C125_9HELO|nr:hypothetical protein LSUE1_G008830 [Lachnellula suecica]
MATIPLTQACYQIHGAIQQYTNTKTQTTTYLPQIFLESSGTTICDGHYGFGSGEASNPYNAAFIPGGVPTNSSFSGPWSGANCTKPYTNVDVFGINGQVLVRDYETAFYVSPEALNWQQVATNQGLAGIDSTFASVWTFDSGDVQC